MHLLTTVLEAEASGKRPATPFSRRDLKYAIRMARKGLRQELRLATTMPLGGTLFRGRVEPESAAVTDCGLAPKKYQRANRFNRARQRAMYCCPHEETLAPELSQDGPITGFWVQKFRVADAGRLLVLTPRGTQNLPRLHQLVTMAERPKDPALPDPYPSTILLRKLSDAAGFDGVLYPSVQGTFAIDPKAVNIVVTSKRAIDAVMRGATDRPRYHSYP